LSEPGQHLLSVRSECRNLAPRLRRCGKKSSARPARGNGSCAGREPLTRCLRATSGPRCSGSRAGRLRARAPVTKSRVPETALRRREIKALVAILHGRTVDGFSLCRNRSQKGCKRHRRCRNRELTHWLSPSVLWNPPRVALILHIHIISIKLEYQ